MFLLLNHYSFAGANIEGLRDDSVIGHISHKLGHPSYKMISGGFMFFHPARIEQYFLNTYNEDWIWILMHLRSNSFIIQNKVTQIFNNPFSKLGEKLYFQLNGEILLNGVIHAYERNQDINSWEIRSWVRIKKKYLNHLISIEGELKKKKLMESREIIQFSIDIVKSYKESNFRDLISSYYENLQGFKFLYSTL
jgi:hypothetical protein